MGRIGNKTSSIISKTIDEMEPAMRSVMIGYFYNHLSVPELAKALLMPDAEYGEGEGIITGSNYLKW